MAVALSFRQRLFRQTYFGTFLKIPRPEVVPLIALSGLDFIICDMEHAQITEEEARTVIVAANEVQLPVVVRLPDAHQGRSIDSWKRGPLAFNFRAYGRRLTPAACTQFCTFPRRV